MEKKVEISTSEWLSDTQAQVVGWQKEKSDTLDNYQKSKEEKLLLLEETYNRKLQLEAPSILWEKRIKQYGFEGKIWSGILASAIIGTMVFLYFFVNEIPSAFIIDGTNKIVFDPKSIKGIIVFLTIVSFAAYGVRFLAKLTLSAFHLKRDAEERKQLTLVYLALIKDGKYDLQEKHIIFQSLFSRAETGLLNLDGAPTMPGVSHIIDRLTQ